jgi:hypothetical protein
MLWPRSLKGFKCTLGTGTSDEEDILPDPSSLIKVLEPQRLSLEQLSVNFQNWLTASGTFGASLAEFPALKQISMPRNFLARRREDAIYIEEDGFEHEHWGFNKLHLALPAALEELILNVDADDSYPDKSLRPDFREWVRDILTHKDELYPSLRRLSLWETFDDAIKPGDGPAHEKKVLHFLNVSADFAEKGVQFSYKVTDVAPDFEDDDLKQL